jgi:hypothetical protein
VVLIALPLCASAITAQAEQPELLSPAPGVLCDSYICADDNGVSQKLTEKYLGRKAAQAAFSQGSFDVTEFTFANGIFCDVKERLCRANRYYGANGKRSGAVSTKYTNLLFGAPTTLHP